MFIDPVENVLYSSINELDRCPVYLILDKFAIHNQSKIEQAFRNVGCIGLRKV